MSFLNCDHCGRRAPGRLRTVYFAYGSGNDMSRSRSRLCLEHFTSVQYDLAEYEVLPADETATGDWPGAKCLTCGQPVLEFAWQWFATCYPSQDERKDYWGKLHVNCRVPAKMFPNLPSDVTA